MLIHCSKKLLKQLNIKEPAETTETDLFSWHANITEINDKESLVLINNKNKYPIIFYNIKQKDLKKIDELIINAIREVFRRESIKKEVIEKYLKEAGKIKYGTSKNRKLISGVTRATMEARHLTKYLNTSQLLNLDVIHKVAITPCSSLTEKNEYIYPNEKLVEDLKEYFDTVNIVETPEEKFNALPDHVKENILNKVFCGNCGVTKIVDYDIKKVEHGILLEGQCEKCGNEVARQIEDI